MGNCCGSKSTAYSNVHHSKGGYHSKDTHHSKSARRSKSAHHSKDGHHYQDEEYKLPKIIVTSGDAALIYLDTSPTRESNRLKNSLRRKFPTLLLSDSEKRILYQIDMIKVRKCYIIIPREIQGETVGYLVNNSKVKAIYFCSNEVELGRYSRSSKIKGFFPNEMELKKAIYYDLRSDESYQ